MAAEPAPQVCTATFIAVFPLPFVTICVSQLAQLWRATLLTWWRGPFVPLSTTDTHESVQLAHFIAVVLAISTAVGAGLRLVRSSAPFSEAIAVKPKFERTRAETAVTMREKRVNVFIFCLSILFFNFHLSICSYSSNPAARFHTQNTQRIWKRFLACFSGRWGIKYVSCRIA